MPDEGDRRPTFGLWVRRHGLGVGLLLVLVYLVVFPLAQIQILALEDGGRAYQEALEVPGIGTTLVTTALLGVGSLIISVVLGTALAWFAQRLPRRAAWLAVVPVLPVVLPAVAVVVGWAFLLSPTVGYINIFLRALPFVDVEVPAVGMPSGPLNIYTVPGIIFVTGLQMVPLIFLFVQSSLRQLNFETIESASVAGASPMRAFFSVVIPSLRPALVYSTAFALLLGLGQLTAPQFLGVRDGIRVLATEVYRFGGQDPTDFPVAAAVASPLLIAGVVFIIAQRLLLRRDFRFVSVGLKGASRPIKPSRLAVPVIATYGIFTLVLPFAAIIFVSLQVYWTGMVDFATLTFDNYVKAFETTAITDALWTSIWTSLVAMAIALPLGYLVAELLYRRRGSGVVRAIVDVLVQIPLGIPAVVFGVSFLYTYLGNPFLLYGNPILIVLVYIVLVLPFSVRMQLTARLALGSAFEDAARAAGASPLRAHVTVLVPMMRGSLAGASVLMFVILTHEFAASLFVRSTTTQVLGTLLYQQWVYATYPMVAVMSIIMSAVTAVGLIIAVSVGGRTVLDRL
ncbi:ABC transporter permease [Microbacterium sp.]|uniref:ABC transporter permease n=1 Tax=Microbacterium sp. TaxID=51671 RepID=UPI002D1DCD77|nr:ABC transporter permease subunit [Microbacterium sp.]HWL76883.1 ABC transporter permease subunit [Microbacterium sp.]